MSTDYAAKYQSARERTLTMLKDLQWTSWRQLRRVAGVRYGARIRELKRLGYRIEDSSDNSPDGKQYRLTNITPGEPLGKRVRVYLPERETEMLLTTGKVPAASIVAIATALSIFRANKHKL
jgi:hypothetical protein